MDFLYVGYTNNDIEGAQIPKNQKKSENSICSRCCAFLRKLQPLIQDVSERRTHRLSITPSLSPQIQISNTQDQNPVFAHDLGARGPHAIQRGSLLFICVGRIPPHPTLADAARWGTVTISLLYGPMSSVFLYVGYTETDIERALRLKK